MSLWLWYMRCMYFCPIGSLFLLYIWHVLSCRSFFKIFMWWNLLFYASGIDGTFKKSFPTQWNIFINSSFLLSIFGFFFFKCKYLIFGIFLRCRGLFLIPALLPWIIDLFSSYAVQSLSNSKYSYIWIFLDFIPFH